MKYAVSHGIINIDAVRDSIMEDKRNKYLSQHHYSIFQGKDGRWRTTLPDETKKNGRRLLAKSDKKELEDKIVEFYETEEKRQQEESLPKLRLKPDITLEELYPIWLDSRLLEMNNINSVKRNHQEWKRYYLGTDIIKRPMRELTVNELRDWAHKLIDVNQFNKRDYYDMALIMKKCFEYLSNEGVCKNTWSEVKINTKKLKRMVKKDNEGQIYFLDEKIKIIKHALMMFLERPWNIGSLTIPLLFLTGMRIGEIVALKYEDITDDAILVRRTEVNNYVFDDETRSFVYEGKKVEDHAKTECGTRSIPLTAGAKKIIAMVQSSSLRYHYYDDGYIFCPSSKRVSSNSIDDKLYRYCDTLGIPRKSAHKIRKTYISQIISSGIDLDTVCKVSGHVDLQTTLQSYYFCLEKKEDVYDKFDTVFSDIV